MPDTDIDTTTLRPVTIRHRGSGVWVGYLIGPGTYPDTIEILGRRVWSWRGGRLEMSQLNQQGVRGSDRLGIWERVEIGALTADLIELRTCTREIVEKAKELAADEC